MNIALVLSYRGTAYHGWQVQKNGASIQGELTAALQKLLHTAPYVSGAGRTDAGVHARRYVASFKAHCTIPLSRLPLALNTFLPEDIVVYGAAEVPEQFDARFDCVKKEYAYYLYPSRTRDPFLSDRAYRFPYPLDLARMQQGAQHFVGRQDFAAVRAMGTPVKSTVRTVFHCHAEPFGQKLIRIRVCGDGFLYNMVRAIAGTLVYVGSGKLSPDDVRAVLASRDRSAAGPTLPACGLYMNRLWYDHTPALDCFRLNEEASLPYCDMRLQDTAL